MIFGHFYFDLKVQNQYKGVKIYSPEHNFFFVLVDRFPFAGPLSVDFTDVQKVRQWFSAICILNFNPKTSEEV